MSEGGRIDAYLRKRFVPKNGEYRRKLLRYGVEVEDYAFIPSETEEVISIRHLKQPNGKWSHKIIIITLDRGRTLKYDRNTDSVRKNCKKHYSRTSSVQY